MFQNSFTGIFSRTSVVITKDLTSHDTLDALLHYFVKYLCLNITMFNNRVKQIASQSASLFKNA